MNIIRKKKALLLRVYSKRPRLRKFKCTWLMDDRSLIWSPGMDEAIRIMAAEIAAEIDADILEQLLKMAAKVAADEYN